MPRITGPNIAEHVAAQEAAVFGAAIRLFAASGVDNVAMAAIAEEVGLARSSLYRYFPTKSAIVHRWFDVAMAPLVADSDRIAASDLPRAQRFASWVQRQLDFLSDPGNRAMIRASIDTDELSDKQRTSIAERHQDLYASLSRILTGASETDPTTRARILLIVGALRDHASLSAAGIPESVVREELIRTTALIAAVH